MAEKIHPTVDSPPINHSSSSKPGAIPPVTYIIQLPKDQIYRRPPPENAERIKNLARKNRRRGSCFCQCLCWTLGLVIILLLILAIAAGVFYFVYKPKSPKYTVDGISITGLNFTSRRTNSPEFDVSIRADNPNDKIGIYYENNSFVQLYFSGDRLGAGVLPAFYQPSKNITVFRTALIGNTIVLSRNVQLALLTAEKEKKVPLELNLKAPIKIEIGGVKTWTLTVKVECDIAVDSLTAASKIVSKDCDYSFKLW